MDATLVKPIGGGLKALIGILAVFASLLVIQPADAWRKGGVAAPPPSNCPQGTADPNDGCSTAPGGTPQHPTLFSGYATRPPWNVAGADYAVGITAGTVLKTPGVDAAPACITVNTGAQAFTVNADNCVINGWDFTVGGGWTIEADNPSNPIITNNRMIVGSNGYSPIVLRGEPNGFTGISATITNNEINGQGNSAGFAGLIFLSRSGTFVIKYNWVRNAFEDIMDWGSGGGGGPNKATYDCRFNLFENGGQGTGHPDIIQTTANNLYGLFTINYNTWIINNSQGTQGLTLQGNQNSPLAVFDGGTLNNNTLIFTITPGLMNFGFAIAVTQSTGPWTANNNYIDPTTLSPITLFLRNFVGGSTPGGSASATGNINLKLNNGTNLNTWN